MFITQNLKECIAAQDARYMEIRSQLLDSLVELEGQAMRLIDGYPDCSISNMKRQQMLSHAKGLHKLFDQHFLTTRRSLVGYFNVLKARGLLEDNTTQLNFAGKATFSYVDGILRIGLGGLLPFKPKGGDSSYISETLDAALTNFLELNELEICLERAAVVFIHHYTAEAIAARDVKDYDNLERTCILNVLQKSLIYSDDGVGLITTDLCHRGDSNRTDIFIMEATDYLEFLTKRDFSLYL